MTGVSERSRLSPGAVASGVAPLVWTTLPGPELDAGSAALLDRGVGGVVLFGRNIRSAPALRELVDELGERARRPLRIAIDHEGGHVARLGAPLTRWPSAMALAATGSVEMARDVAAAAGAELAALGIDVNFAPVADVAVEPANPAIGARSFGSDPRVVGRFAAATVEGLRRGGVASVAKHFPGHGRTAVDSHVALPAVSGGRGALDETDLPPFRACMAAGVDAVMVSHVAVPGVSSGDLPATLDPALVAGLLRGQLGWERLVVTDDLAMGAVVDVRSVPEAALAAVRAGADVVLPGGSERPALDLLERAQADGRLTAGELGVHLARVERFDADVARLVAPPVDPGANSALAARVAAASLTLLRGGDLLPIPAGARLALVELPSRRPSPVEEAGTPEATLADRLRARWPRLVGHRIRAGASVAERLAAIEAAGEAEIVLVATRDAFAHADDRTLAERLLACGRPVILVALRNPYDLVALGPAPGAIAAYADVPATVDALADALARGAQAFPGRLPMRLEGRA